MNITIEEPKELFVENGELRIHCIDSENISPEGLPPLVIIPGMVNSAEEYTPFFREYMKTRRCIFISIRGRGKSDAPAEGYAFEDQVSDIRSVVEALGLTSFHLFGHSVGGTFALGYALRYPGFGKTIIGDYAALYPPFGEQWANKIRDTMPGKMSDAALDGITRDARAVNMYPSLAGKIGQIYLIFGSAEDSLVRPKHLDSYHEFLGSTSLFRLKGYGHELFKPDGDACIAIIDRILDLPAQELPEKE